MPRQVSPMYNSGLPVWDTFEVLFFLASGIFIGVVLGFLLPSVWRTLRRRFRKIDAVYPLEESALLELKVPLQLWANDDGDEESFARQDNSITQTAEAFSSVGEQLPKVDIAGAFVLGRYLVQQGNLREAVKVYLELLKSDRISKGGTNRALFELAQCYEALGMKSRALDTYSELYYRKTTRSQALLCVVRLCAELDNPKKLLEALQSFKGSPNETLRQRASYALCKFAEIKQDLSMARLALRWDAKSPYAKFLIWGITGSQVWKTLSGQTANLWTTLFEDLATLAEFSLETGLSPFAAAENLSPRLAELANMQNSQLICQSALQQFSGKLSAEKLMLSDVGKGVEPLVVATLLHSLGLGRALSAQVAEDNYPLPQKSIWCFSGGSWITQLLQPPAADFFRLVQGFSDQAVGLGLSPEEFSHFLLGFTLHLCSSCGHVVPAFAWSCAYCGSLRPLVLKNQTSFTSSCS